MRAHARATFQKRYRERVNTFHCSFRMVAVQFAGSPSVDTVALMLETSLMPGLYLGQNPASFVLSVKKEWVIVGPLGLVCRQNFSNRLPSAPRFQDRRSDWTRTIRQKRGSELSVKFTGMGTKILGRGSKRWLDTRTRDSLTCYCSQLLSERPGIE